ncbi:MAG: hypothetical protein LBL34_07175 [Clostridiales bacterium]|jgi:RNA polymerase sigma factor (sigma-70 family)|nr:hypothetical protein [Clostridiales bacterium]
MKAMEELTGKERLVGLLSGVTEEHYDEAFKSMTKQEQAVYGLIDQSLSGGTGKEPKPWQVAKELGMDILVVFKARKSAYVKMATYPLSDEHEKALAAGEEHLDEIWDTVLTERERDVLRLRFGLGDGKMRTLEDVGDKCQISRERVRQIEAKAIRKLRRQRTIEALKRLESSPLAESIDSPAAVPAQSKMDEAIKSASASAITAPKIDITPGS